MKISKRKKEVFRIGDRVELVNKVRFVRCGYPNSMWHYWQIADKKYKNDVEFLASKIIEDDYGRSYLYNDILTAIAVQLGKDDDFGGNERKMYEEPIDLADGKTYKVIGKRRVFAGTREYFSDYYPPNDSGFSGYYLAQSKCYVILKLVGANQFDTFETWEGNCKKREESP